MPRSLAFAIAVVLCVPPAGALEGSLRSAEPMAPGRYAIEVQAGFPYVSVASAVGLAAGLDAALALRSGWGRTQRVEFGGRWRFHADQSQATALRIAVDSWLERPADSRWLNLTGRHDATLTAGLLSTRATQSRARITLEAAVSLVANSRPPLAPLGGTRLAYALGPNLGARVGLEMPVASRMWVSVDVGADWHLTGFDPETVLPAFAIGFGASP